MALQRSAVERIVGTCALVVFVTAMVGTVLSVVSLTGRLGLPPDVRWVDYAATYKRLWNVPVELYVAAVALALFVARGSGWSVVWATLLLAFGLGFISSFMLSPLIWAIVVGAGLALFAAGWRVEGGIRDFAVGLVRDFEHVRTSQLMVWRFTSAALVFGLAAVFVHGEMTERASSDAADARLVAWYEAAKTAAVSQAGIHLVVFSDYQCPSCRVMVPQFLAAAASMGPGVVQVTLRDFPLDAGCNDQVPIGLQAPHTAACAAAVAVRIMLKERPDQVEQFRAWLYGNQENLTDDVIRQELNTIGFREPIDLANPSLLRAVKEDIREATRYGIYSTPALVLNGVRLSNLSQMGLEVLLRHEVRHGGNAHGEPQR